MRIKYMYIVPHCVYLEQGLSVYSQILNLVHDRELILKFFMIEFCTSWLENKELKGKRI